MNFMTAENRAVDGCGDDQGLWLSDVGHSYGGKAVVSGLHLAVGPGELVCLLGPSGCGKTTTLRIAAGLEVPARGTVRLNGKLVSGPGIHLPPEARHVGLLFQDFALFPHLDVTGNVEFGLTRLPKAERSARAAAMLAQVGMADFARAWPHQLSGGQQQRVALARALAPNPGLMLLDEPFSGLDKRLRDQVRDQILDVLKASNVATLMVTHDPEEAMYMADRIAIMRGGRIVQLGTPAQLYRNPVDRFVAAFMSEVNTLAATVSAGAVDTALGRFAAPGLNEGQAAEVVLRPEAITFSPDGPLQATVTATHMLGAAKLIRLRIEHPAFPVWQLQARVPGTVAPVAGDRITFDLDRSQIFIFPQSNIEM